MKNSVSVFNAVAVSIHVNLRNSLTETERDAQQTFRLERKGLKRPFRSISDYLQLKKVAIFISLCCGDV